MHALACQLDDPTIERMGGLPALMEFIALMRAASGEDGGAGAAMVGSAAELREALARNGHEIAELFREWDADGSGTVDKAEFGRALLAAGSVAAPGS